MRSARNPEIEPTATIDPPWAADTITRPTSRRQRKVPRRLIPMTRSHSLLDMSTKEEKPPTPALRTATSTPPNASCTSVTALTTSSSSEMSQRTESSSPPSPPPGRRSSTATRAPASRRTDTVAAPIPLAPPVTMALVPASSTAGSVHIGGQRRAGRHRRGCRHPVPTCLRPGRGVLGGVSFPADRVVQRALLQQQGADEGQAGQGDADQEHDVQGAHEGVDDTGAHRHRQPP